MRRDSVLFASLTSLVMEKFAIKGRADGNGTEYNLKKNAGQELEFRSGKVPIGTREDGVKAQLAVLFQSVLDRNRDGLVSKHELLYAAQRSNDLRKACARVPGLSRLLKPEKWRHVFNELDCNGDTTLTEEEFVRGVIKWGRSASVDTELRSIFSSLLDRDGDGRVTKSELLRAAQRSSALRHACARVPGLSQLLKPGRWEEAFQELDADRNSSLDEREFVNGVLSWATADDEGYQRNHAETVVAAQIVDSVLESVFAKVTKGKSDTYHLQTRSPKSHRCRTFEADFFNESQPVRFCLRSHLLTGAISSLLLPCFVTSGPGTETYQCPV